MVFSTSNFFPDDYDVEVNDEGWGKLMIENSILILLEVFLFIFWPQN